MSLVLPVQGLYAKKEDAPMDFCQICDKPLPQPMLSEGICEACWREHAKYDLADQPLLRSWAESHAARARGPLLLTGARS